MQARLLQLLRERAFRTGEFTLSSGRKSSYYIDGKQVTLSAEGSHLFARLLVEKLRGSGVEAIGGLTLGADPIVGAVAAISRAEGAPIDAFIVRKEPKSHGTRRRIEGPLREGARVAIVDDVITTGGSLLRAIEAVREEAGAQVVKVLCLVDRQEGAEENLRAQGYELEPIFTLRDLTGQPPA
jgi:orotate phosphoribosyltransferase